MAVHVTCSRVDLAHLLDLSEQRVGVLTRMKVLSRTRDGYDLAASVRSYLRFLRSQAGSLTDERARLTKAQADLMELKLKVRQGELVDRSSVDKQFFSVAHTTRDNFQNLPSRTAALVAAESDQHKCYDILAAEVRQILEGLSHDAQEDHERPDAGGRGAVPQTAPRGASRYRRED